MKTVQSILLKGCSAAIILLNCSITLQAQNKHDLPVKDIIESRHYIFEARIALPASGRTRQLTSDYTLKVFGDSIIADLPYFGRAYSAPSNLTGGGISFTSVKAAYSATQDKKKRWQIMIKPTDANGVESLSLVVFEDGSADLNVNSRDRQPISFRGYITAK